MHFFVGVIEFVSPWEIGSIDSISYVLLYIIYTLERARVNFENQEYKGLLESNYRTQIRADTRLLHQLVNY